MENTFDELDKINAEMVEKDALEYEYEYPMTKEEGDKLCESLISVAQELSLLRDSVIKMHHNMSSLMPAEQLTTEAIVDLVFAKIQEARRAYVRPTVKQAPGRPVREPTKTKVPKVKKAKPAKKAKAKKVKKTKVKKTAVKKAVKKTKAKKATKSKPSSKAGKPKKR